MDLFPSKKSNEGVNREINSRANFVAVIYPNEPERNSFCSGNIDKMLNMTAFSVKSQANQRKGKAIKTVVRYFGIAIRWET